MKWFKTNKFLSARFGFCIFCSLSELKAIQFFCGFPRGQINVSVHSGTGMRMQAQEKEAGTTWKDPGVFRIQQANHFSSKGGHFYVENFLLLVSFFYFESWQKDWNW